MKRVFFTYQVNYKVLCDLIDEFSWTRETASHSFFTLEAIICKLNVARQKLKHESKPDPCLELKYKSVGNWESIQFYSCLVAEEKADLLNK